MRGIAREEASACPRKLRAGAAWTRVTATAAMVLVAVLFLCACNPNPAPTPSHNPIPKPSPTPSPNPDSAPLVKPQTPIVTEANVRYP